MLYRFQIELSNIDNEKYESLDFRVAQHPSEGLPYLLTRVLAYVLSYQEGLEFSPSGLGDPESAALRILGSDGNLDLWIEIGNPSPRKLHRASKAAKKVVVYTYKNGDHLMTEMKAKDVYRASEIQVFVLDPKILSNLEAHLAKNNRWTALLQDGLLTISAGSNSVEMEIKAHAASNPV